MVCDALVVWCTQWWFDFTFSFFISTEFNFTGICFINRLNWRLQVRALWRNTPVLSLTVSLIPFSHSYYPNFLFSFIKNQVSKPVVYKIDTLTTSLCMRTVFLPRKEKYPLFSTHLQSDHSPPTIYHQN